MPVLSRPLALSWVPIAAVSSALLTAGAATVCTAAPQPVRCGGADEPATTIAHPWLVRRSVVSHDAAPAASPTTPFRVAVIGSGMGGAAAAYFVRQEVHKLVQARSRSAARAGGNAPLFPSLTVLHGRAPHPGPQVAPSLHIDVYERRNRVGGRVNSIDVGGDVIEAGASIAVDENRYLKSFAAEAGIEVQPPVGGRLAIWDGDAFVYEQGPWSFLNTLALLWRYNVSLVRLSSHVDSAVTAFGKLYALQESGRAFRTATDLYKEVGLYDLTQVSLLQYLQSSGACTADSPVFHELVNGVVRVNYNQDADRITALAGLVGLAPLTGGKVWQTKDGSNKSIVAHLLKRSGADVRTNTAVDHVWRRDDGMWVVSHVVGGVEQRQQVYDRVILAAPARLSQVKVYNGAVADENKLSFPDGRSDPYMTTVATFVRGKLRRQYFHRASGDEQVPDFVLSKAGNHDFTSIGLQVRGAASDGSDNVYKVFSKQRLSPETLDELFSQRSMTKRVSWVAYPEFQPPESFDVPFDVVPNQVFYVHALERGASAMEVIAIGGRNVALLLAHGMSEEEIQRSKLETRQ